MIGTPRPRGERGLANVPFEVVGSGTPSTARQGRLVDSPIRGIRHTSTQSKGTHSSSSLNVVGALGAQVGSLLQTTGRRFPSTSNISARGMREGCTVPEIKIFTVLVFR